MAHLFISKVPPFAFGGFEVVRITNSKDGYPSSLIIRGNGVSQGVDDRIDIVKELFGRDPARLRLFVDRARAEVECGGAK